MKKLHVIFLVIIIALTTMIPAGIASADSNVEVSGEYTITVTGAECITSVCNQLITTVGISYESMYDGNLIGTAQECLYYGFSVTLDTTRSVGIKTFSGTVLGKEGTFTAYVCHQNLSNSDFKVEQTIISGTNELAGIQGNLVFTVTKTDLGVWEGTYSGIIKFTP